MEYYGEVLKTEQDDAQENINAVNPYKQLPYYEQVQKLRDERQRYEDEMKEIEKERTAYQRNVLRKKIKFDDVDKATPFTKYHTPVKGKRGQETLNTSVRHSNF